jgi:hypothetical protein
MAKPRTVTKEEALRRLRLFNEKAEKLQRGGFVQKVFRKDHGVTIHFGENQPVTVEKRGADEGAIDALSLTLRFFFQKRDNISLEQISEVYEHLPVSNEDKDKARRGFHNFQSFLDKPTGISFHGQSLTNRTILETLLYGNLAHTNDDKRRLYEDWVAAAPFDMLMEFCFEGVAAGVLQFIVEFKDFNNRTIQRLEASPGESL